MNQNARGAPRRDQLAKHGQVVRDHWPAQRPGGEERSAARPLRVGQQDRVASGDAARERGVAELADAELHAGDQGGLLAQSPRVARVVSPHAACDQKLHATGQPPHRLDRDRMAAVRTNEADHAHHRAIRVHAELRAKHKALRSVPEALPTEAQEPPILFSVIKKLSMPPMSPERAAREMDDMGYDFWMFRDEKSKQVSVIFRRVDDSFGLLLPVTKGRK